jgi:hypothetical protein
MARHEVIIHQNTGATAETAPYLGSYIAKETVPQSAFVESVAAKCGLPAIQVAAIIDGSFETIEELERAGLVRVHTDLGVVCGVIRGSFPTADAAFDPERNSLELALWLDDSIRLDLADEVPKIVTDETQIFLSHLAPSLHKPHAETVEIAKEFGAQVAYDGLRIII